MDILSYTNIELKNFLLEKQEKSFKADQIFDWIYQKGVLNFFDMKNLSKKFQKFLERNFSISLLKLRKKCVSKDKQTIKFLWQTFDGYFIESVLILSGSRKTLCVSSQIGCKRHCAFCASGKEGIIRNLKTSEIINQILSITPFFKEKITNVVFMGMGEPLDNYDNVVKAIYILNDSKGLNISQRKITVSTVGVLNKIQELQLLGLNINLTISLHAPNQEIRERIIPSAKAYLFDDLINASERYFENTKRNITFEYILIRDVNDQALHAEMLAKKLKKHFKVNLIPFNKVDRVDFKTPKRCVIEKFERVLKQNGINVKRRYTKGSDIAAACGQLAVFSQG